jgi:serine/threonine protein kinase
MHEKSAGQSGGGRGAVRRPPATPFLETSVVGFVCSAAGRRQRAKRMSAKETEARTFVDIDDVESRLSNATLAQTSFDFVSFAKLILYRNVDILEYPELRPIDEDSSKSTRAASPAVSTGTGSLELRRLHGEIVALKLPRSLIESSNADLNAIHPDAYSKFMSDTAYEIQVMTYEPLCDHPNIVKLLGLAFQDPFVSKLPLPILVMPPVSEKYPNLERLIEGQERQRPLPLHRLYELISDIADGITALHDFGLVHGGISPPNILLEQRKSGLVAKLGNFSHGANELDYDQPITDFEKWLPPDYRSYSTQVDKRSLDIYAFGRVAVYLCTAGELPSGPGLVDVSGVERILTARPAEHESTVPDLTPSVGKLTALLANCLKSDKLQRSAHISQARRILLGGYAPDSIRY